ncbi:hypothetical protein B0J12DRAFT_587056, partial [Macrophomina phaseolina]
KRKILENFRAEIVRVVIVISALEIGIDILDIRLIIYVDEPRDFLDYAQESGRVEKNNLVSEAVIIAKEEKS